MKIDVVCPSCHKQHAFSDLVPFRAECDACSADLHVCLSCRFHDRYVENECREDDADPVAQKDRRNLCELWKPIPIGEAGGEDESARARARLEALFGGKPAASPAGSTTAGSSSGTSAADEAKRKLEALFKKK